METVVAVSSRLPPPAPRRSGSSWLWGVGLGLVGAGFGFTVARLGVELPALDIEAWGKAEALVGLLWLPVAWLLVVAVHEGAHLVGGWAMGGRFLLFLVGPFKWQRTPSGVRFEWNRSWSLFGGMAACPFPDAERLVQRQAVMAAAGPVASLVMAGVGGAWLIAAGTPATLAELWLNQGVAGATGLAAVVFLVTGWPAQSGGHRTDGAQVALAFSRRASAAEDALVLRISGLSVAGVRPREWPEAEMRQLAGIDRRDSFGIFARYLAFAYAGDRGEWAEMQRQLDAVVAGEDQLPPVVRELVRAEYAWLLATHGGEATAARAWLETAGQGVLDPATIRLAEAAVARAEGRGDEAVRRARQGLGELRQRSMGAEAARWTEERLQALAGSG